MSEKTTIKCPKCSGDLEVEYEIDEGSNGDPETPYYETWNYAVIVEIRMCECGHELTERQIEEAEKEITKELGTWDE